MPLRLMPESQRLRCRPRGAILARGLPARTMEQGLMQRTVIIEFDSLEKAIAAYDSPGYREALAALGKQAAERDMRIVPGVD